MRGKSCNYRAGLPHSGIVNPALTKATPATTVNTRLPAFDNMTRLPVDLRVRRIMIVDDDNVSRQIALRLLQQFSFGQVLEATNGEEALSLLKASETPIDLLLVDLIMPIMDGFDLIDRIRSGERGIDQNIPIIIMSGRTDPETLQRVRKMRINGFVAKPPQARNFFERIVAALQSAKAKPNSDPAVRKLT
jgi:CheY-like chemotaxis protein